MSDRNDGGGTEGKRRPRTAGNRDGRPWKRPDGRWTARAYGPDGGRPQYVYGATKTAANNARKDRERDLAEGLPTGRDETVAQFFDRWTAKTLPQQVRSRHLDPNTADSYADNARLHIVPHLGHIQLRKLTVSHLREWQAELLAKPSGRARKTLRPGETELPPPPTLSVRTVAYQLAILHRALNDAMRDEIVTRNVASLIEPPRADKGEEKAKAESRKLTKEQTRRLLAEAASDPLWCYWLVVLTLGLRRGEGLGLRWQDIDWDAKTIRLEHSVQRLRGERDPETGRRKGQLVLKALKTDASEATVPAGAGLLRALRKHRKEQEAVQLRAAEWLGVGLVFATPAGTALEPRNVYRAWTEEICARAGCECRIHDLRHACGTYLAGAGIHPKAIQATLRHARMETTEIYVHALEEVNRDAADAMDAIVTDLRKRPRRRGAEGA